MSAFLGDIVWGSDNILRLSLLVFLLLVPLVDMALREDSYGEAS